MQWASFLHIGISLTVLGTSLSANGQPSVDFGAYGQLLQHREMNGQHATTVMVVPEFEFHLAPKVTFQLETGLEYDKDADSNGHKEFDVEEAAFTLELNEEFTARIGKMHLPVGVYNLYHEPVYFHSVFPSEVEQKIIPDEWHENGAYLSYRIGGGKFGGGIYGGLSQEGMSASEWIRGTSLEGKLKVPGTYAAILRYDYGDIDDGMLIGGSLYHSGMNGVEWVGKSEATLWELHARKKFENGFECDFLYAQGHATKTGELSSVFNQVIGKETRGWYANAAYDIAPLFQSARPFSLPLFVRYETFNTQAKVTEGLSADPANDRSVTTVGINYRPWPKVVFKADYQFRDNKGGGERNRVEFGAGFVY